MTTKKDLHNMSLEQLGQLFPIVLSEPSEKWKQLYQTERALILKSFPATDIVRIDHIGSTAIPGIKAKPTIDILLQVSQQTNTNNIIDTFKSLAYEYTKQPDNPAPYMMFLKGYALNGFKGQAYHVHVRYRGNWNEIRFRDYLIKHTTVAKEYEALKLKLAKKYRNDREAYTNAKTEWIGNINERTR